MDFSQIAGSLGSVAIVVWVVVPSLALLILYAVIRRAVAMGLRDHYFWMKKHSPSTDQALTPRRTLGRYSAEPADGWTPDA
jgi:hypothetical protein